MRRHRILHAPRNICNIPWVLAQEQKQSGHVSHVMKHDDDVINSTADFNLRISRYQRWSLRYLNYLVFAMRAALSYDTFVFHTTISLLPHNRDLPFLKRLGKKVCFYFHGREIRPAGLPDRIRYADHYFVSTPDLLEFAPGATWLPQALDLASLPVRQAGKRRDGPLRVLHALNEPTQEKKERKGTPAVEEAVQELQKDGYPIELILCVAKPHDEYLAALQDADIVVDQLVLGWYGVISLEALFLGKPVLVHIREDLRRHLPAGCPLILTSKKSLKRDLKTLIDSRAFSRYESAGPAFVRDNHGARAIARRMDDVIFSEDD